MTVADVQPTEDGAVLSQDGQELKLTIVEPADLNVTVISLDPAPLEIDKTIEDLKRVEIRVPAYLFHQKKAEIRVRLSAE